jgi:hypothetical protein
VHCKGRNPYRFTLARSLESSGCIPTIGIEPPYSLFRPKTSRGWSGLARASAFVVGQAASGAPVQARQQHDERRRRGKPAPHRGGAWGCCRYRSASGKGKRLSLVRSRSSGGRIAPAAMRKKRRRSGRRPERIGRLAASGSARLGSARLGSARLGSARLGSENYGAGDGHVKPFNGFPPDLSAFL